mmetsp:Transcript_26624/g.50590  ORF Transcript_26624/g.50590 Transcript_26624/m.50590 type:complete len:414 (+) Transcript_26624:460-1701(+)
MVFTVELRPGNSLGMFALGMPVSEVLKHIQDNEDLYPRIEIKYSEQEPLDHDLVLNFPGSGFHLRFDPCTQRLRLIEIYDVSRIQVRYANSIVGGPESPTTFVQMYSLFGPTYPGSFDSGRNVYLLHYPGLLLLFPIPAPYASCCMNLQAEVPLEFPDGTTPVVSRLCVYHCRDEASSLSQPSTGVHAAPHILSRVVNAAPPTLHPGSSYMEKVEAWLGRGLRFVGSERAMEFGCTPQDVWADLGAPGGITYKNVDTMVIHAKQEMCTSGANSTAGAAGVGGGGASSRDYFYNYYRLGLDVLFDGHLHEAKKFVLHTNAVGHVDFNTYLKCNFVVRRGAWPGEEEQVYVWIPKRGFRGHEKWSPCQCHPMEGRISNLWMIRQSQLVRFRDAAFRACACTNCLSQLSASPNMIA